jgi:hypothetical protein
VEFSTAFLWKCTCRVSQKSGSVNITAVRIYTFPEEWNFQQHSHGKIKYPRREEASIALLCESTISQKDGSFNSTAMEISSPSSIFHFPISDTGNSKTREILPSKL